MEVQMELEKVKDRTHRCVGCSQCFGPGPYLPFADGHQTISRWKCPTLEYYRFFTNTARSKAYLAREVAHRKLELDEEIERVFFACPDCGICDQMCPPIPHMYISRAMKAELARKNLIPEKSKTLNAKMRENFNLFGSANRNRAEWAKTLELPRTGDILYFAGCYASWRQPDTARSMIKILRKAGLNPAYLGEEEWCCGLHAGFSGDIELERKLARHNVEAIAKTGAHTVIFSCANCYRTFYTDYPFLVEKIPFKVQHAVEFLPNLTASGKIKFRPADGSRITLHDPCHFGKQHIGRHRDLYEETRQIIRSIPGIHFVEMENAKRWSACCGGGNSVTSTNTPEFTDYHSTKRCEEAEKIADIMLTPCVRCVENLSTAAKRKGKKIGVKSLLEFACDMLS